MSIVHLSVFLCRQSLSVNHFPHRYRDVSFCPKKGGDGTFLKRVVIPIRGGGVVISKEGRDPTPCETMKLYDFIFSNSFILKFFSFVGHKSFLSLV